MLLTLVATGTALAVPASFQHSGRMVDVTTGLPLNGNHDLTVSLYDTAAAASPAWTETIDTPFDGGYFNVILGESTLNPLDSALLGDTLWIGVAVDGGVELQRLPVSSVPYAYFAETATNVSGGIVDASEIRIDGTPAIDADTVTLSSLSCTTDQLPLFDGSDWTCAATGGGTGTVAFSDLTGVPAGLDDGDDDTLGALGCFGDETPTFNAGTSSWGCSADRVLTGAEVDAFVVDGAIDLHGSTTLGGDGLLTTTTPIDWTQLINVPSDLADGDDTVSSLDWSQITSIPGDIADGDADGLGALSCGADAVPRFDGSVWTCAVLTAADVGAVDATGDAVIAGALQIGDTSAVCDAAAEGTLRVSTVGLEVCLGDAWQIVAGTQDGSTQAKAATNCSTLHMDLPALPDGMYWIDPNGGGTGDAFEVYCDMTTDGGGWTRTFTAITGDTSTCGTNDRFQTTLDVTAGWAPGGEIMAKHFDTEAVLPAATPNDGAKFETGPYSTIHEMFEFNGTGNSWTYQNSPLFNVTHLFGASFGNSIWWDYGDDGNKRHVCVGSTGLACWYDSAVQCGNIWHEQIWHSSGHAMELYVRP